MKMSKWTDEEIALTRYAWWLHDMNEKLERDYRARQRGGIVVAGLMGVVIAALFVLSQW